MLNVDQCTVCGETMQSSVGSTPYYALPGVQLHGVRLWTCVCGESSVELQDQDGLNSLLVELVTKKPGRLTGAEIRFLRKSLGWSGRNCARYLGVRNDTVSRWEHGVASIGRSADKLLRVCATRFAPIANYQAFESFLDGVGRADVSDGHAVFAVERGADGWREAA